jgi:hypothetical protein
MAEGAGLEGGAGGTAVAAAGGGNFWLEALRAAGGGGVGRLRTADAGLRRALAVRAEGRAARGLVAAAAFERLFGAVRRAALDLRLALDPDTREVRRPVREVLRSRRSTIHLPPQ